jgi:ATP-dependent DNA helicase RecQ
MLAARGIESRTYHAGLSTEIRTEVQNWFMASTDGIVVCTIAFGMGIDKADLRQVRSGLVLLLSRVLG